MSARSSAVHVLCLLSSWWMRPRLCRKSLPYAARERTSSSCSSISATSARTSPSYPSASNTACSEAGSRPPSRSCSRAELMLKKRWAKCESVTSCAESSSGSFAWITPPAPSRGPDSRSSPSTLRSCSSNDATSARVSGTPCAMSGGEARVEPSVARPRSRGARKLVGTTPLPAADCCAGAATARCACRPGSRTLGAHATEFPPRKVCARVRTWVTPRARCVESTPPAQSASASSTSTRARGDPAGPELLPFIT